MSTSTREQMPTFSKISNRLLAIFLNHFVECVAYKGGRFHTELKPVNRDYGATHTRCIASSTFMPTANISIHKGQTKQQNIYATQPT